ncbi:unnamed protein product [Schistocephalus solidus]|uniref:Uncharacterized protein n=1 Tax=Schistocephalus solidus TaxID=70667 RepID=A0A183T3A6_SCHSO|nr:unnamed protein product [Schistocephalus solidus]
MDFLARNTCLSSSWENQLTPMKLDNKQQREKVGTSCTAADDGPQQRFCEVLHLVISTSLVPFLSRSVALTRAPHLTHLSSTDAKLPCRLPEISDSESRDCDR